MSYGVVYARALGRAALAACAAVPMGAAMAAFLRVARPRGRRMLVWAGLLLPFVTPALLVGYGYASFSLSLVRHPLWNEALYTVLVWLKIVPPAALVLYFAPSVFTPQAVHCRRLLDAGCGKRPGLASRIGFMARGPGRKWLVAFGVAFLLAFGEFEIASLMVVPTWTVRIFDAQAGGLALPDSLRLVSLPAISEAVVVLVVLLALVRARGLAGLRAPHAHPLRVIRWASFGYLALAITSVTLVPGWIVLKGAVTGLPLLLAVQGVVGGVEVQHQLLGRLRVTLDEKLHRKGAHPHQRLPVYPVLQPSERGGAGQGRPLARVPLGGALEGRIVAESVVVGEVLIAQGDAEYPLGQKLPDRMGDPAGIAGVGDKLGQPRGQPEGAVGLPQQEGAAVGGQPAPGERGLHALTIQLCKDALGSCTLRHVRRSPWIESLLGVTPYSTRAKAAVQLYLTQQWLFIVKYPG